MRTIEQVESEFEVKIQETLRDLDLLPEGYRARVRFHGKKRDKRRSASIDRFLPESDTVRISFEPAEEEPPTQAPATSAQAQSGHLARVDQSSTDPVSDLIRALDRAESRPGYEFISLKWFRDTALPTERLSWAISPERRQDVLRNAIDNKFVLTSKVPNPKNPEYPVTAIRLNRLLPFVKATLGQTGAVDTDFHPVIIQGEPLSATILRERR